MTEIHWFKEVTRAMALELKGYLGIKSPSKFFGTPHKNFDKDLSKSLEMTPALDLVTHPPMDHKHSFKLRCKILGYDAYMFQCRYCRQLEMINANRFWGKINPRKDISNAE